MANLFNVGEMYDEDYLLFFASVARPTPPGRNRRRAKPRHS